jgi:peptide-methionine (S)-S-oxide reductase
MRLSPLLIPLLLAVSSSAAGFGCHSSPDPDRSTARTTQTDPAMAAHPDANTLIQPGPDGRRPVGTDPGGVGKGTPLTPKPGHALAAFAAGCFWGVEDAFRQLPGVTATAVGYTGGHTEEPTYEAVCQHGTGHAETVLVEFDPKLVSYERLLRAFFQIHDPTTLDRQGPDEGDQYRSEVFTFSDAQADAARAAIADAQKRHPDRIVTRVESIRRFYKAEGYHQQYAERTGSHGCPTGKITGT